MKKISKQALKSIPWDEVRCQSGYAERVPDALCSLADDDSDIRQQAYWQLDNHVIVQGGLYEAAFYVVPFLVQNLSRKGFQNKESLNLLCEISNGASAFDSQVRFRELTQPFPYFVPDVDGIVAPLVVACRFAVGLSFQQIIDCCADDPNANVMEELSDLLGSFPEFTFAITNCRGE